jgi:fatty acid desaturase
MPLVTYEKDSTFHCPNGLNLLLLIASSLIGLVLLYIASHSATLYVKIIAAFAFSLVANTLFSLLHEAVHGMFHSNAKVNLWAGRLAACWFPTSFSLQKSFHLTHHTNNRNQFEQFDVLHQGDVVWLKYAQWYSILSGLYWWITVVSILLYLIIPVRLLNAFHQRAHPQARSQTGGDIYFKALVDTPTFTTKMEILGAIVFQVLICYLLNISLLAWVLCYAAFAFQWSSLQYTDHAFSPLNKKNGAWNLKIHPAIGVWFLNYHYHLAHHQHPNVPWRFLPQLVDKTQPFPSFFRVWKHAWRGPRAIEDFPVL